jgi:subtilisin family serine protease
MSFRFLLTALLSGSLALTAQSLDHRQGELIVQLGAAVDAKEWVSAIPQLSGYEVLGRGSTNIYLVRFDHDRHAIGEIRHRLWLDNAVEIVQLNRPLTYRARPNDLRYDDQWHHRNLGQIGGVTGADHHVEPAWDVTTGGVTVNGDTIVVAIIDDGIDTDHEDLLPNIWVNRDEIPGNNIDDDNNGYVDDINGYNTFRDTSDIEGGNHGTPVAGYVGAVGNNSVGVTGMNWNVKMMIVSNNLVGFESDAIKAYSYVLEAREDYNATDGAEGAYVVATNASWGLDRVQAEDSPIWCAFYDRLGAAGILNAGATANSDINVEEEGDMPTTCPSDHLIAVTNLMTNNRIRSSAGFGNISIDLGAYGEETFTTRNGNSYDYFGGTSAATPSVAGAIALLYSAPCAKFGELLVADPAAATRFVKRMLLETVRPNASLNGITVTGGAMDVGAAMTKLMNNCNTCFAPTSFSALALTGSGTELVVDWKAIAFFTRTDLRYRSTGTSTWTTISGATPPYTIANLPNCTSYDVQIVGGCGGGEVATNIITTATDGCCAIPEDFMVTAQPNLFFQVTWTELLAGRFYRVRYRRQGEENWLTRTSTRDGLNLAGNIEPCTAYEFEFQTDCDTLVTDFGDRMVVVSSGCGACNEATYCDPGDNYDNEREWIREVNLGGLLINRTGQETDGYASFGEITDNSFVRGGVYPLTLQAGVTDERSTEAFRVYIDYNQDGFFSNGEIAAEATTTGSIPAYTNVTIPLTANTLLTRMRVIVQFRNVGSGACAINNTQGEAEDYCIRLVNAEGCPPPGRLTAAFSSTDETTTLNWSASAAAGGSYRLRYRLRDTENAWVETDTDTTSLALNDINLCGAYEVEVASLCEDNPGEFRIFYFNDVCTSTADRALLATDWRIFPNPAVDRATVAWPAGQRATTIDLFDLSGRELQRLPPGNGGTERLELSGLPAGLYVVRLRLADGRMGVKRLVVTKR